MAKYYFCETDNADKGIRKVTLFDDADKALDKAKSSTAKVHFISTVNPFEDEQRG